MYELEAGCSSYFPLIPELLLDTTKKPNALIPCKADSQRRLSESFMMLGHAEERQARDLTNSPVKDAKATVMNRLEAKGELS